MMPKLKGLPVFTLPSSIKFYVDDVSSHKQILTIYNPYDFRLKFQVCLEKSARRDKYTVVDSEGTIKSKCCVDIVIRHLYAVASNVNVVDRFSIDVESFPTKQFSGRQIITATLLSTKENVGRETPEIDAFQQFPRSEIKHTQPSYALIAQNRNVDKGTNYVALIAGLICIAGLFLPTEGEGNPNIPECLHLAVNFKLIFAFVLGMATIITLRL
ncbi:motile sperm domain-containing protein 1-like [Belonocnema kinseyi]|uniref:motile sperm domain-containing protein 1-like n=1 Tax=Belonocnema kinseyi TaxID=2817044 RepID=UPI00143DA7A9|nr:motile sperm domain-containing protein 1-like [Belonocnema kinseyi]XP_033226358.1 motile sperm domain-containing protein 1-like [Belonocnema kinseyi]